MVALSLASLCVFIFSAYAYGATTVLAFRQVPLWGRAASARTTSQLTVQPVTLALFVVSTAWFVLHSFLEFRHLVGGNRFEYVADIVGLSLGFGFPPLIMHTVLNEQDPTCMPVRRAWRLPIVPMYFMSFGAVAYWIAAIANLVPRPRPLGAWIGLSIGLLFTTCSVYCIALLMNRASAKKDQTPPPRGLRRTMIGLFLLMIPLFFALIFLRDRTLVAAALDRVTRTLPIYFLIASVYFENRFEFYDLIVKRAAMLAVNLFVIGAFLALTLGALERLPAGAARPWLFAIALLPVTMVLAWLQPPLSRWLDRMWFGREFTPVEAVKHVLSAMQPATDERALIEATQTRLSEMFRTRIRILLDDEPSPEGTIVEAPVDSAADAAGAPLRVAVVREAGSRTLLSEDLALLHSLASVFGYMLENVRLQQRRQEQDQIARELRLQTSRSELKALRAQINPHFLFNALNAIASLIHTDPTRADAAVEQLAEVFRYTLRRSEHEWAPLDQELAFAQAYLDVEQARFGRRLSSSIEADASAARAQVPSMLLHTLVENAVKHGISQVRGTGRIDIRARVDGEVLLLDVSDTGPGPRDLRPLPRPPSPPDQGGRRSPEGTEVGERFGLRSVRDRLRGHFGERASLELTRNEAQGTTIARLRMPFVREETTVAR